jgi:predicted PurR-regulated permease PerM
LAVRSIVFIFFLWVVRSWLVPVALGGLFAVLLQSTNHKLTAKLSRFRLLKKHGPLLLTTGAVILVIIPLVVTASAALSSLAEFFRTNPQGADGVQRDAVSKLLPFMREMNVGSGSARELLNDLFEKLAKFSSGVLTRAAGAIPTFMIDVFLFVIALFYFLRDGDAIAAWIAKKLPFRASETDELYSSIRDTIHGALLGTVATAAVQGGLVLIAFLALQIEGAFLFASIAALLSFVPVIGSAPVTLGAVLYLVLQQRYVAAGIMFAAAIVVGVSDNVVRPWVTSTKGNLHPLLGLVSIVGGITVFGPFGIFLGPVTAAMAVWTLDTYGNLRRAQTERAATATQS